MRGGVESRGGAREPSLDNYASEKQASVLAAYRRLKGILIKFLKKGRVKGK
jgi:hypothetical protein